MTPRLFGYLLGATLSLLINSTSFATVQQATPKESLTRELTSGKESVLYQKALARIESTHQRGERFDRRFYGTLNWVGRTALINYSCSSLGVVACRGVLKRGLDDRALVVRDHSLRVLLSDVSFSENEKQREARRVIDDYRNYRGKVALWIVDRAQKFLKDSKG